MFIKKLQRSCLDVLLMGSHRGAFPGMFAEDLAPDRHNIEAFTRLSSSGNKSTPSFCCMAVSSLNKSLTEDVAALLIPKLIGLVV